MGWRTSCASWTPEVRLLRAELLLFFLLIRLPFMFFRSFVQSFVRSYFRSYVFYFIKSSFNLIGYVYLFWKKFLFISSGNKRHIVLEGKRHFFWKANFFPFLQNEFKIQCSFVIFVQTYFLFELFEVIISQSENK